MRISIISDTYYPDSRATIAIVQRMAERLSKNGNHVVVLPIGIENTKKFEYPECHQTVKIEKYEALKSKIDKKYELLDKMNHLAYRIALAPKKFLIESQEAMKWNNAVMRFVRCLRGKIYEVPKKKIVLWKHSATLRSYLENNHFDMVISVSLPFETHICVGKAVKNNKKIRWIPVCFDPYAYDETISAKEAKRRIAEENKVYKNAEKVMMLSQFKQDYVDNKLKNLIEYFELPNIRNLSNNLAKTPFELDDSYINCVFLGNLYKIQRHPEFVFRLFKMLQNNRIRLYMVGALVNIEKEYIDNWVEECKGRLFYFGRISQDEAIALMNKADILLNIGGSTTNQCPSKLLDYVNTGKPILNISKIDKCTSMPYILRYPNKYILSEKEEISAKEIADLEEFLLSSKEKEPIAYEVIEKIYEDCTMAELCKRLEGVR